MCLCVLLVLIVADVCVPAWGRSYPETGWITGAVNVSSSAPFDIHASNGYVRSYPRDLVVNYSYAISAPGTSFQISIHVAQSFAYANVTGTTIVVNPKKPFTQVMEYDGLGNDVLTVKFDSQSPLGQFYLTVLQHVTVYSIKYTIDPAKVGSYDKSSELYKVYTKAAEFIQSDNPEIVATSRQIVGEEKNPYLAALRIHDYVVKHMTRDNSLIPWSAEHEGALFALHSGKGVCRHYPALFAALARAAGIPTIDIWGSTATDGGRLADPGDLKHNWVHFYLPNYGWIPADPTFENMQDIDHFAWLQDNSRVPVMSVNYLVQSAWWSGGEAQAITEKGAVALGEQPTIARPTSTATASPPQGISWNALSDLKGDLYDQNGRTVNDLDLPYVDITNLANGFVGDSLCFRFDLNGKPPGQIDSKHVGMIWYSVFVDVDTDSRTGYQSSSDFAPDYMLNAEMTSRTHGILYSSVWKYAGTGKSWSWTNFDYNTQQPVIAGGSGQDSFALSCRYRDISAVEGSEIRLFARSGITYDGKTYNDLVPDKGTLTVTLPSSAVTTMSSGTAVATTTPSTSTSTTGSIVSTPSTAGVDMSQTLLFAVLGIAVVGITILVIRKRRPGARRES
jgi:transglutaminase-like putative cysteine protease